MGCRLAGGTNQETWGELPNEMDRVPEIQGTTRLMGRLSRVPGCWALRRAKNACAADDSLIKHPEAGKCFQTVWTVWTALASVVLWSLPGLCLTPGNLGRRDPRAGGAPTCTPSQVHMAYRRKTVDRRTADWGPERGRRLM